MPRPNKADYDRVDAKVAEDIEKHGWSDIAVFPVEGQQGPYFNYTVGLTLVDHPELLCIGLNNVQGHQVLASAWAEIEKGVKFQPNTYTDQLLQNGVQMALVEVEDLHHDDHPLSMATRFFGKQISALQVVWPDAQGRFPWHADFEESYRDWQPLAGTWKGPE